MRFQVAYHTDIGREKSTNQDSLGVLEAKTDEGRLLLAVLCDGMGGLDKGEVASAALIRAFEAWFQEELPGLIRKEDPLYEVRFSWERMIEVQNQSIGDYGRSRRIQLGSTLTAMLFLEDGSYLIGHVGDSRAYLIRQEVLEILTSDQTVVANEVRLGKLTPEQAASDPRKNVLLQCIGASGFVEPEFREGKAVPGECYLLCSDGFRHELCEEELLAALAPEKSPDEETMRRNLEKLTWRNLERGERDNISALLLKIL